MGLLNRCWVLWMVLGVTPGLCVAQSSSSQTDIAGCLTRAPNNSLQFEVRASGKTYAVSGDVNLLQRHVNQLVAIPGGGTTSDSLNVNTLRVISESCTSALPSRNVAAVAGKVGRNIPAPNVSTTLSAGETTPGFQTESDLQQAAGTAANSPHVKYGSADSPYAPVHSEQAGQSEAAANANAAAAFRAEMYPEQTLGVTQKSAPASSVRALQSMPQTLNTTQKNPPKL